jgi:hypothetical protein
MKVIMPRSSAAIPVYIRRLFVLLANFLQRPSALSGLSKPYSMPLIYGDKLNESF